MKITIDKLLVLIIYLGFTSVATNVSLLELQADAVAHKGLRLASIGTALLLCLMVFSVRNILGYLTCRTLFPLFLYFCSVALTFSWSPLPGLTAFKSFELLLIIGIGLVAISTRKTAPIALFNWIIAIFILQLSIIWIEALLFPGLAFKKVGGATPFLSGMLRGIYPVVNPNTVGFLGGIIAVSLLPKVLRRRKLIRTENLFFVLGCMAVVASYSRGALLATVIVIAAFSIYSRNYKLVILLLVLALLLLGSGKYDLLLEHVKRGSADLDVETLSSGRLDIWHVVLRNYSDFLFGQGYAVGFRIRQVLGNTNAHNSIIEILTGAGIAGVLCWLFIYFRLIKDFVFYFRKEHCPDVDSLAAANALCYLLISSFTNVRAVYLDFGMLLLVSIIVYVEKVKLFLKNNNCLATSSHGKQDGM